MVMVKNQKLGKNQKALDMHYTKQGELGSEDAAKKSKGGDVNSSLVGSFKAEELTMNAAKKGTGGIVESSLWALADDHSLSKDFS